MAVILIKESFDDKIPRGWNKDDRGVGDRYLYQSKDILASVSVTSTLADPREVRTIISIMDLKNPDSSEQIDYTTKISSVDRDWGKVVKSSLVKADDAVKSHLGSEDLDESTELVVESDWTYWEMPEEIPKDYKGPFEYPHYFKDFDGRYIGYVYPPYKSKNSRIDDIEGYQVELYDNVGTEPVGDFTRVFRNLKSAERYVEKMYQSVVKNESKSVNESYYDGKVSIQELSEIRDKVDNLIEMMDDLGMSTIKSDPNTYGLSTPFIGTSSGYVDLLNPEKYLDEEEFDDDD